MYIETLQQLGLAQNEARIYETLLQKGELSVGRIAAESSVNRRNVYDSLNRLIEKGLVFEIVEKSESRYQAADPETLSQVLEEKQQALNSILPVLRAWHQGTPRQEGVMIYRGVEGWKRYMRDILRVGKDVYTIGAKGIWATPGLQGLVKQYDQSLRKRNIKLHILYDAEVKERKRQIRFGEECRFLPKSGPARLPLIFTVTM
ncbi:hypothetical protein KGQ71_04055 [Patescibacteria group bacterium]|nr:hypothetical protein [Patescibacteria group bacterium]